jgi:hypothetical protein
VPDKRPSRHKRHVAAAAAPPVTASAAPATLTAGSALLSGLSFDGVASVRTANGQVQMLEFSMSSLYLSGGTELTVTQNGRTVLTRTSTLDLSGNVVLYTTQISGDLLGVPVTFTPASPPPAVLPVMRFTNVVTKQPFASADSAQPTDLVITQN